MSDIKKRFELSIKMIQNLKQKPNDNELLILYGLYKQSGGDCVITKPTGILNFKEKSKWESWYKYRGMTSEDAMTKYSNYVMTLIEKYGVN
jgi:diazepam-binding inhibitor (GABA receptor modulating acyl-CoA-binding protein)